MMKSGPDAPYTERQKIVFTWFYVGHIGIPLQRNCGHFGVSKQPSGKWTPFLYKYFLFLSIWIWPLVMWVKTIYMKNSVKTWSISTWEHCSFLRDLKTYKNMFTLPSFSVTRSLNSQLPWRVTPSKDKLLQICSHCGLLFFLLTTSSLHLVWLQII